MGDARRQIGLRLDIDLIDQLDAYCDNVGLSRNEAMTAAIADWLGVQGPETPARVSEGDGAPTEAPPASAPSPDSAFARALADEMAATKAYNDAIAADEIRRGWGAEQSPPGSENTGTSPGPPRDRPEPAAIADPEKEGQPDPAPAGPTYRCAACGERFDVADMMRLWQTPTHDRRLRYTLGSDGGDLLHECEKPDPVAKGNEATDRLQATFTEVEALCDGANHPPDARLVRAWGTTCDRVKGGCGAVVT